MKKTITLFVLFFIILLVLTLKISKYQTNIEYNQLQQNYSNNIQYNEIWNCTRQEAANGFQNKVIINPFTEFESDPYLNMTPERQIEIDTVINNKEIVCAIKYEDQDKKTYRIKQFLSAEQAQNNGYIVTHQGKCNRCSTLQDLSVYLREGLTEPVEKCGIQGFLSLEAQKKCLMELGFTGPCAEIWYYNTQNTRRECLKPCVIMKIYNQPYVDPEGNLNKCLQCDEDKSGPVFKYYAGRTRRDSGIHSEIPRPEDTVYPMSQCYY